MAFHNKWSEQGENGEGISLFHSDIDRILSVDSGNDIMHERDNTNNYYNALKLDSVMRGGCLHFMEEKGL